MDHTKWRRYLMQTATTLEDLDGIIKDTGIEYLDREHLRLVEYILEMGEMVRYAATGAFDSDKLASQTLLFQRFLTALEAHFKTEESFMDRYELKGKAFQHQEHEKVLADFNVILEDFKNGILSTFQTVRINLLSELVDHINGIDHQTFLLENFLPVLKNAREWEDVAGIIKSTGVPFVDSEHRDLTVRIIELKNYLAGIGHRVRTRTRKEELIRMLKRLFKYAQIHFNHEEAFLKKYSLDSSKQAGAHEEFLTQVHGLTGKIEKNRPADLEAFIEYLFAWWVNHINGIDYVEFHFSRIAAPVFSLSRTADDFSWLIRKTGIESVDSEHAHLIGLLLKLNDRKDSDGDLDVKTELGRIAEFAARHFKHEEKMMEKLDIKGRDIHGDAHDKLLRYVEDAMKHAVSGRSRISPSLLKRIMRWWVDHTNGMDYDTFVLNRTLT